GLLGEPWLLAVSELVLGRTIDRPSTRWQGMFLPAVMRAEIASHYGARVETVYERTAPLPVGNRRAGTWLLIGVRVLRGVFVLLGARLGWPRLGRAPAAVLLGILGLFIWGLAACSPHSELRYNEVSLLCWPTDFLLPFLPPRALRRYLGVRLMVLGMAGL